MKLVHTLRSVIGTRDEQQDCAACINGQNALAAIVCDGMGGLDDGYAAAEGAVQTFTSLFKAYDNSRPVPDFLLKSVDILDEKVCSLRKGANSGTTLVAAIIEGDKLYWLSVGDSRLYILRRGEFVQATRDHNYAMVLDSRKDYVPTESDISKKAALVSFIGIGGVTTMDITSKPVSLANGDIILITSDGLYNSLPDEKIKEVLMNNEDIGTAADILIADAEKNSPDIRDNTTFIIIKTEKSEEN